MTTQTKRLRRSSRDMLDPIPEPEHVDAIDLRILAILAHDSRISQRKIAREIEMSAGAVSERIARMEHAGIIRGYSVDLDWARLGLPLSIYIPVIANVGTEISEILAGLHQLPEVQKIDVVSGPFDLLVYLRVRDMQHLSDILLDRIWSIPSIHRTETLMCLAATRQKPFTDELLHALSAALQDEEQHKDDV